MEKLNTNYIEYKCIIGNIYTANTQNSFIEAFLVKDGEIIFTGNKQQLQEYIKANKIQKNNIQYILNDSTKLILPGFIDCHVHPYYGYLMQTYANVYDIKSLDLFKDVINNFITNNPSNPWILGIGYSDELFINTQFKVAHYSILDEICYDKPMLILRFDAHAGLINSKAIEIIGLNNDTVNPPGGNIVKLNGNLTGVLDDSAISLAKNFLPNTSKETQMKIFNNYNHLLKSNGITSYMDAAVNKKNYNLFYQMYTDPEIVKYLPRMGLSMALKPLFFDLQKPIDDEEKDSDNVHGYLNHMKEFFNKHKIRDWKDKNNQLSKLNVNTIKLFIDGVFESNNALLHKQCKCSNSFYNNNNNVKSSLYTAEELKKVVDYANQQEIQLHCHCVGDLAVTMIVDAIEQSNKEYKMDLSKIKHYLAHCQLVHPKDIQKIKDNFIAANFTPQWCLIEEFTGTVFEMVGKDRIKDIYPIKDFIDAGILVGFGSDWPAGNLSPLEGIEIAVTHKHPGQQKETEIYVPEQRINVLQAVRAYTIESAKIMKLENITGSIEVGKRADFIVLNNNIFELPVYQIKDTNIVETYIDCILVYQNKNFKRNVVVESKEKPKF